jgi:hypothetical protein
MRIDEMVGCSKREAPLGTHLVCPLSCSCYLLDITNASTARTMAAGPSEKLKLDPSID